jgi:hypothetical protein
MSSSFSGYEPLVGEVTGLRTFRVDDSGYLLPLYSTIAWYDGANTAECAPPTGERSGTHPVPSPDCECGFYAFGTEAGARQHRQMRYVQAVISCWGGLVAGTQGFRAEHARIVAIWLHPNVPRWARHRIASRYPSARLYADRDRMLAEHPLTRLECYEEAARRPLVPRLAGAAAIGGVLTLGLLPQRVLGGSTALEDLWLASGAAVAGLILWLLLAAHTRGARAAAFVAAGLLAWLLAPALGLSGWLLRLPLLRGALLAAGGYLMSLRPGFFPIDHGPRERAFCGVRA